MIPSYPVARDLLIGVHWNWEMVPYIVTEIRSETFVNVALRGRIPPAVRKSNDFSEIFILRVVRFKKLDIH